MTTTSTPILLAFHTMPTSNGANINTLATAMVRVLQARRDALLRELAGIERELGQSPTTAEIRSQHKCRKCPECGAEL
jgi:hypothetical protein